MSASKSASTYAIAVASTAAALVTGYYTYKEIEKKLTAPKTKILPTKSDVAKELCAFVAEKAKAAIAKRGVFHLAVAGGSLLDLLVGLEEHKDAVNFSKVVLSFANHKCVAPSSEKATLAKCKVKFADAVGITQFVAPIDVVVEGSDGSAEAAYYAKALSDAKIPMSKKNYPIMDLILLGLGADGHVGSCHPLGPAVLETKLPVAGSPKSGEPSSITFTIETMNSARQVCVIVCGGSKGKKEAVKRAMTRPAEGSRGSFPAQLLKSPLFFLDEEAAADL